MLLFFCHFSVVQLVGIAYEVHDSNKIRRNRENGVPDPVDRNGKPRYQPIIDDPSAVDIVHYSFCFIGLFTGKPLHLIKESQINLHRVILLLKIVNRYSL